MTQTYVLQLITEHYYQHIIYNLLLPVLSIGILTFFMKVVVSARYDLRLASNLMHSGDILSKIKTSSCYVPDYWTHHVFHVF